MAVQQVFGGDVVWHSEIDPAASKVLAHRFPGVLNLGDITKVGWADVPAIDVLCGGFPCQDVSAAGKRAGIKDGTRSGLWAIFAEAIDALRPQWVVIENVRGLLSATAHRMVEDADDHVESASAVVGDGAGRPVLRALGAVLGDLCDLGYDAQWATVSASSVGAPHRRERVFILATDASGRELQRRRIPGIVASETSNPEGDAAGSGGEVAADAECGHGARLQNAAGDSKADREGRQTVLAGGRRSDDVFDLVSGGGFNSEFDRDAPDASGDGWYEGRPESAGFVGGSDVAVSRDGDVALLPTPQARDFKGTDSASDHNRHSPGMDAVTHHFPALLPTPNASDGSGGGRYSSEGHQSTLPGEVRLLPTLQRTLDEGIHTLNLADAIELTHGRDVLLCTPSVADSTGGHLTRSGGRSDEPLLPGQAREMSTAWGKYEPAIRRWEQINGPAPSPTEPNKNGNPRLSAAFSEWMMGWPAGWVTDPDVGISRNDQLRIVGNGVCPQQAVRALRYLLSAAAA